MHPRGIVIAATPLSFQWIARQLAVAITLVAPAGASAEVGQLRISRGFGVHYLPLDGGNDMRSVDITSTGTGGFLTSWAKSWAKAKGNPNLEVIGLGGSASGGMIMTTRNPPLNSLREQIYVDQFHAPGRPAQAQTPELEGCVRK